MATLALSYGMGMMGSTMGWGMLGMTGFQVGWGIGSLIGNAVFSKSQKIEGPRMSSLDPKLSTHTRVLARIYGTEVAEGNCIWHKKIEEIVVKKESGKGGGSVTNKLYYYYWSFSMSVCEGEKEPIKVWADGKLIFDRSNNVVMEKYPGVITTYTGSETQLPSALQEANEGVGNVSAYRGVCYIDFNRLPLADFGNKPVVITSLCTDGTASKVASIVAAGQVGSNYAMMPNKIDIVAVTGDELRKFRITDRDSIQEEIELTMPATYGMWSAGTPHVDTDGEYAYFPLSKSPNLYIGRVNLASLEVERVSDSIGTVTSNDGQIRCDADGNVYATRNQTMFFGFKLDMDIAVKMTAITGLSLNHTYMCRGLGLDVWAVAPNTSTGELEFKKYNRGEVVTAQFTVDVTSQDGEMVGIFYHVATGYLIVGSSAATNEGHIYAIDPLTETLVWDSGDLGNYTANDTAFSVAAYTATGNYFYAPIFGTSKKINLVSGDTVSTELHEDWTGVDSGSNSNLMYDDITHSLLLNQDSIWKILPLDRMNDTGQVTVQSVLEDLSINAGHVIGDITASDFSADYMSFQLDRRAPIRNYIEPILGTFFGDIVESDYGIKFVKRSATPDGTVDSDDLIFIDEEKGDIIKEMSTQEVELPYQIDFVYIDPDLGYQNRPLTHKRYNNACFTRHLETISTPIVITETQAKNIPAKLLNQYWVERWGYKFNLPWKYLEYDPTDVLTVNAGSNTYTIRLTKINWKMDMTLACEGVTIKATSHGATGTGQSNLGWEESILEVAGPTVLHVIDMPALRDQDLHTPLLVFAANGYFETWKGCVVETSPDLGQWTGLTPILTEAAIGNTLDTLADHNCNLWDRTNTFDVTFFENGYDTPAATTEAIVVADRSINLLLVGNELMQAVGVTLIADNVYRFSTLIRGRFGTEHESANHVAGERVIILDVETLKAIDRQTTDVGAELYYRGVSLGDAIGNKQTELITYTAENLKPWSVVYVEASRDGSNNLTATLVRRSRRLAQAFWSPALEEDSEDYEVDVMDGVDVVRTITTTASGNGSVITPGSQQIYYDADDITADGLTPGDPHTLRIYQLSEAVGRGNVTEETL